MCISYSMLYMDDDWKKGRYNNEITKILFKIISCSTTGSILSKRDPRQSKVMGIQIDEMKGPRFFFSNGRYMLYIMFVCLFVCFEFYVPLKNFSLTRRSHHYRWRAANFDLCSTFMAVEQWRFFSVPHLLDTGHLFIMVISEDPWHSRLWFEHPTFRLRGQQSDTLSITQKTKKIDTNQRCVMGFLVWTNGWATPFSNARW